MKDPMCEHCTYKRFTCGVPLLFKCDPWVEAKLKHAERKFEKRFYSGVLSDYNAEDRYVAGQVFAWAMIIFALVLMLFSTFKQVHMWWKGW